MASLVPFERVPINNQLLNWFPTIINNLKGVPFHFSRSVGGRHPTSGIGGMEIVHFHEKEK